MLGILGASPLLSEATMRSEFEAFFTNQPFYLQLRYTQGDRLLDFDEGIGYRNLIVQIAYVCWCKGDKEFVI